MNAWRIAGVLALSVAAVGCDIDSAHAPLRSTPAVQADATPSVTDSGADTTAELPPRVTVEPGEVAAVKPTLLVLDQLIFGKEIEPGIAPGFDLDGTDADVCGQSDYVSPYGGTGVDNQLAVITPLLELTELGAVQTLLQNSIEQGGLLVIMELSGVDDLVNDKDVKVRLRLGEGTPLLGTNGRLLAGQTFDLSADTADTEIPNGKIVDGILTAGPADIVLPAIVFGIRYELPFRGGLFRGRLTEGGGLVDGMMGGIVSEQSLIEVATAAGGEGGDILKLMKTVIAGTADLSPNADGECQDLSAAVVISAVSGFFFEK